MPADMFQNFDEDEDDQDKDFPDPDEAALVEHAEAVPEPDTPRSEESLESLENFLDPKGNVEEQPLEEQAPDTVEEKPPDEQAPDTVEEKPPDEQAPAPSVADAAEPVPRASASGVSRSTLNRTVMDIPPYGELH